MAYYGIPGYDEQSEWDYPPEEPIPSTPLGQWLSGRYPTMDIPIPSDLYTRPTDPLRPGGLGPASGLSTRARLRETASGLFSGPNSFVRTAWETAKSLPGTVARAVDFPAASLRGEVDPLSNEGLGRAADLAGTVTLGGGAVPRAAPSGALRAGAPQMVFKKDLTAALRVGDQVYAGPTHGEIMSRLPPEVQKAFWDQYSETNEGFVDRRTGQYMDRSEAGRALYQSGQLDQTLSGDLRLSSEDLDVAPWDPDIDLFSNADERAGAVPLAMDRESRMRRAADMYSGSGYHGTSRPVEEFHGDTWITDDPRVAGYYADRSALRDAMDETRDSDPAWGDEMPDLDEIDPRYVDDLELSSEMTGQNIMPLRYDPGKQLDMTELGEAPTLRELNDWLSERGIVERVDEDGIREWENEISRGGDQLSNPTLWKAMEDLNLQYDIRRAGYDSVKIEDVVAGNMGVQAHQSVLMLRPENIRSTAAAFDPSKRGQSGLLLANADERAGAVPLAMDRESRMRRAAEMGFNIDTYHGTVSPDIREFERNSHSGTRDAAHERLQSEHLIERGGERLGIPDDQIPYLDRFNDSAVGVGETIYPLKIRGRYAKLPDLGEEWEMLDEPISQNRDIWGRAQLQNTPEIEKVEGVGYEVDGAVFDTLEEAQDYVFGNYSPAEVNIPLDSDQTMREYLESEGYSGVQYENIHEDPGSISYLTFNPKDIRSTAAAFDPEKSDSANILAANRSVAAGAVPIFSRMEREAAALPQPRASGAQWNSTLQNRGVPREELDWTGVADWLKERGTLPVTKEELLAEIGRRQTQVGVKRLGVTPRATRPSLEAKVLELLDNNPSMSTVEKMEEAAVIVRDAVTTNYDRANYRLAKMGADENWLSDFQAQVDDYITGKESQPRHSSYQLPGGENYREVLLTLPVRQVTDAEALSGAKSFVESMGTSWDSLTPQQQSSYVQAAKEQADMGKLGGNGFTSSHWDEPNVLAHMRVNDRYLPNPEKTGTPTARPVGEVVGGTQWEVTLPGGHKKYVDLFAEGSAEEAIALTRGDQGGDRVLFAEEIQSDWHQRGRREGYQRERLPEGWQIKKNTNPNGPEWELFNPQGDSVSGAPDRETLMRIAGATRNTTGVPDAPFKKSWPDLVLRRLVADAIEGGYDAIAWTDGATQAARYDLSKQVGSIRYNPRTQTLRAYDHGGNMVMSEERVAPERLPDYIGKEASDKIINNPTKRDDTEKYDDHMIGASNTLEGVDLQVGGEGMRAFYDQELPRRAKKLFGRYGATVEDSNLPSLTNLSEDAIGYIKDYNQNLREAIEQAEFRGDPEIAEELRHFQRRRDPDKDILTQAQGSQIHLLRITPEMRAAIQSEGLPLFSNKSKAAGAATLTGSPEQITSAAIRSSTGGVYIGKAHWNAFKAMQAKEGVKRGNAFIQSPFEEGFLTNQGRFVTRDEAMEIARSSGQTKDYINDTSRFALGAEDLKSTDSRRDPANHSAIRWRGKVYGREMPARGYRDHTDLLRKIQSANRLTDEQIGELVDNGEIEFGYWNSDKDQFVMANKSRAAGATTTVPPEKEEFRRFLTAGRFASGGTVTINGETTEIYQGKKQTMRGRPLTQSIAQGHQVQSAGKSDRLQDVLRTLVDPTDPLFLRASGLSGGVTDWTEGLIEDPTPGRTDRLPTDMPADSYVVPADIVSALGQGNTLAGGKILDAMFERHSDPAPRARGGSAGGTVPVIVAGGEYVVSPDRVRSMGSGDAKKGHKILDAFVLKTRQNTVRHLKKLPGPAKS